MNKRAGYLGIIACIFFHLSLTAQQRVVHGTVFIDANGNGKQDAQEAGISNVVVSDQNQVTLTDANGSYSLTSDFPYQTIQIVLPNGYLGQFWHPLENQVNFPLKATGSQDHFVFIHASDCHVDSLNLPRMARFRTLLDSIQPAFVLMSGDLVRDALRVPEQVARGYFELYKEQIGLISCSVFSGVGNHELFGIERDKSLVSSDHPLYGKNMYRYYLGPDYYAFNFGGIHFVSVDAMEYQNLYYYGGIDTLQLSWLNRELAATEGNPPVITFNHIPLVSPGFSFQAYDEDDYYGPSLLRVDGRLRHRHIVADYDALRLVIGAHPYPLALSGHYHAAQSASYELSGTQFRQTSALTRPDRFTFHGFEIRSGFTVYEVMKGEIIRSTFVPLNLPDTPK